MNDLLKYNKKGYALVFVTFIGVVLMIIAAGLSSIINMPHKTITNDLMRTRLKLSAEAGLNSLYMNLARLSVEDFKKKESKTVVGDLEEITVGTDVVQLTVDTVVTQSGSPRMWKISARALSDKLDCVVSIDSISLGTFLDNGLGFTSTMLGTSAWSGTYVNGVRGATTDRFRGKTYFGGRFHIAGTPWFEGKATYAQKTNLQFTSKMTNGTGGSWGGTGVGNTDAWFANSLYKKGIWDQGGSGDFEGSPYASDAGMNKRYNKIFEDGYKVDNAPINFDKSTYSWEQLRGTDLLHPLPSKHGMKITNLNATSASSDVNVEFELRKVTIAGVLVEKNFAKISGGGLNKEIRLDTCNVITIQTKNTDSDLNHYVKVKGQIDTDISLAIDKGVVKIVDDVYYKGFDGYRDENQSDIIKAGSASVLSTIQNAFNTIKPKGKFGLINYQGHVLIDNNENLRNRAAGGGSDDALLVMGAIFAPKGQFGANSTPDATYYKNAGSYDMGGRSLQVMTFGSIFAAQKAYYKSGTNGISTHINTEPRYEAGQKPGIFPNTVREILVNEISYDILTFSTGTQVWSCKWETK